MKASHDEDFKTSVCFNLLEPTKILKENCFPLFSFDKNFSSLVMDWNCASGLKVLLFIFFTLLGNYLK